MEARVRPQLLIATALLGAGCSQDREPSGAEVPARIDPAQADVREASKTLEAILERCHGRRRGTFDRIAVELRTAPDAPPTTITARLPGQLRATQPNGETVLVDGEVAFSWTDDRVARQLDGDALRSARRLRDGLSLICLQPLMHANAATRLGSDHIEFVADGERYELRYDPARDAPRSLRGPTTAVEFLELYDSGTTLVPILGVLDGTGTRHFRFLDTGVRFDDQSFAPPTSRERPAGVIVIGGPSGSAAPRREHVPAVSWLMIPDPGDWTGRYEAYLRAGPRLRSAGYGNGGDPTLLSRDDQPWFVVPFRAVRTDPDPIEVSGGERIVEVSAADVLAVDAGPGRDFDARIRAARDSLLAFASENGIRLAVDSVRVELNLVGRDPRRDPDCLTDAPLRVVAGTR